jgi:hypothetical protein
MEINIPKPGILPLHENISNKKKKGEKKEESPSIVNRWSRGNKGPAITREMVLYSVGRKCKVCRVSFGSGL